MISNPLANLIRRSPLVSIQEHMRAALECAREVPLLLEALCEENNDEFEIIKQRIFDKESEADRIKNVLRGRLPKSLFMPVDRRDLLEVLHIQDSIADTAEDIAELLYERQMMIPEEIKKPIVALSYASLKVCEQSLKVIEELDELLETGFRGHDARQVEDMVDELNKIEDEADVLELQLSRTLFQLESEMDAVSVIMWYRIIEWTGDLGDYAEKVGDRVRLFIAR
jgi:predicted phosphate transport protein (TIGR00153 family)